MNVAYKKRSVIKYVDWSSWQTFVVCNLGKARQIILKFYKHNNKILQM